MKNWRGFIALASIVDLLFIFVFIALFTPTNSESLEKANHELEANASFIAKLDGDLKQSEQVLAEQQEQLEEVTSQFEASVSLIVMLDDDIKRSTQIVAEQQEQLVQAQQREVNNDDALRSMSAQASRNENLITVLRQQLDELSSSPEADQTYKLIAEYDFYLRLGRSWEKLWTHKILQNGRGKLERIVSSPGRDLGEDGLSIGVLESFEITPNRITYTVTGYEDNIYQFNRVRTGVYEGHLVGDQSPRKFRVVLK